MSSSNAPDQDSELRRYERLYAALRRRLAAVGYLWRGTVLLLYHQCRRVGCRCARGGRFRHGPYYVWTRKVKGKTVTRMLPDPEGRLYMEWIRNRKDLEATIRKMQRISQHVAKLLLRQRRS